MEKTASQVCFHSLPRRGFLRRMLDAVLRADARHRDSVALRGMSQQRLDDIGLTEADVERAFGPRWDAPTGWMRR